MRPATVAHFRSYIALDAAPLLTAQRILHLNLALSIVDLCDAADHLKLAHPLGFTLAQMAHAALLFRSVLPILCTILPVNMCRANQCFSCFGRGGCFTK